MLKIERKTTSSNYKRKERKYDYIKNFLIPFQDKRQLEDMEEKLNTMRADHTTKRDIAIAVSCQDFYKTGLMTDIVQVFIQRCSCKIKIDFVFSSSTMFYLIIPNTHFKTYNLT